MSRVVLAIPVAGNSSRMGYHKGLLQLGKRSLLLDHLESTPAEDVTQVVIIAESAYTCYNQLLVGYAKSSRVVLLQHYKDPLARLD